MYINRISLFSHLCLIITVFILVGANAFAQDNIDIPQPKAKPQPRPKPAVSLKLAAEKEGERVYYTESEWSKLSPQERVEVNKIGLVIGQGDNAFLLSLFNNMGRGICSKTVPFQEAFNKTGNQLPTKAQMQTIKNNKRIIGDALDVFGGDHICSAFFWCKDGSYINFGSSHTFNNDAMFRIATTDIENGFNNVTITKAANEEYDFFGKEIPSWAKGEGYLQVVGLHGKYGYINDEGETVIPIMYDEVDVPNHSDYWDGRGLMPVCINSKWGYINYHGEVVVPIEYDAVSSYRNYTGVLTVKKEGLYGVFNLKGDALLPIQFKTIEGDYFKKNVFAVNMGGKYGFYDSNYQLVIPCKYDYVSGFSEEDGLCAVGIDGKYGFINKDGEEVIPLIYDFADSFHHGLAPVIKNRILGFINPKGAIVVPHQYKYSLLSYSDVLYNDIISYGGRQKVGGGYDCTFEFSPHIAFIPSSYDRYASDYKYAIINNEGQMITPYKYNRIVDGDSSGFTVEYDDKIVYLDIAGNEYNTKEERSEISSFRLAVEGYPEGQYEYGISILSSNPDEAFSLLKKSAAQGYSKAALTLGIEYERKKDLPNAYEWYVKAFELGDNRAARLLGLLCDRTDNSIDNSAKEAIEWYQRYTINKSWANYRIGVIYYYGDEGNGASQSYDKAYYYLSKSVEPDALYMCGWMLEHGRGVEKDYVKAIDYYWESKGFKDASQRIKELRSSL